MKRSNSKNPALILPILLTCVAIILTLFGSNLLTTPSSPHFTQLDTGWSVFRGENVYENVTLSEFNLGKTTKGEVVTISTNIPPMFIVAPTIMFKSSLSSVIVKIDGEDVYSFGTEYSEKGLFIPKKYNIITLDDETKLHSIEITFTIGENDGFRKFYPIYYGAKRELVQHFLQLHRLPIFVGGFLAIYSCLLLCLGIFLSFYSRNEVSMFVSAAVSMLLGTYTYAYNDIFCFLSDRDDLFSILEYVSLYLIPLAISVLLYSSHSEIANLKQRILVGINAVLPFSFIIAHMSGQVHINTFVPFIQVIAILETVFLLPSLIIGINNAHKEKVESETYIGFDAESYLLLGFIIMIVFALLEIVKYNVAKFMENSNNATILSNIHFLTMGMLFFIICLFIYYFLNGIEHINAIHIKEQLEGLAYTDTLTGLMNRAKCMQYMASIEVPYAIVSLDLDRLKYVNDTYGHLEGDRMIKAFAALLNKSFEGATLIGRTGGDEFLVAFENPAADVCDKCIRALEKNMDAFNKDHDRFTLSASSGYAYSTEAPNGNFEDIFYLADTRMYEMKETHHA